MTCRPEVDQVSALAAGFNDRAGKQLNFPQHIPTTTDDP
jgi:hypothetical protein